MSEVEAFLESTMPRLTAAETALGNGDAGPRMALWSHQDPVTLVRRCRHQARMGRDRTTVRVVGLRILELCLL